LARKSDFDRFAPSAVSLARIAWRLALRRLSSYGVTAVGGWMVGDLKPAAVEDPDIAARMGKLVAV